MSRLLMLVGLFAIFFSESVLAEKTVKQHFDEVVADMQVLGESLEKDYHEKTAKYYQVNCEGLKTEGGGEYPLGKSKSTMKIMVSDDIWSFDCGEIRGLEIIGRGNDLYIQSVQIINSDEELLREPQLPQLLDLKGSVADGGHRRVEFDKPVSPLFIMITTKTDSIDGIEASYDISVIAD